MKTTSTRHFNSGFYPLKAAVKKPATNKEVKQVASLPITAKAQRPLLAELPVTWDEAWFANYE